jgi:hypothetical protein
VPAFYKLLVLQVRGGVILFCNITACHSVDHSSKCYNAFMPVSHAC